MFYGNNILIEHSEPNFDIVGSLICESVCMTEYNNRIKIYENCTDETERAILEVQLDILNEISIKDIGDKIIGFFKKIWEMIKRIAGNIKDFFTRAKMREVKAAADQLAEEVKKLKEENEILAAKNDIKDQENKILKQEKSEAQKQLKTAQDENRANKINSFYHSKNSEHYKANADKLLEKLTKIMESGADNKYIYFNPTDYLTDNGESSMKELRESLKVFADAITRTGVDNVYFDMSSFDKNKYYIIKEEILKDNEGGIDKIKSYIEKHLEEKAEKEKKQWIPIKGKEYNFFKYVGKMSIIFEDLEYNKLLNNIEKNVEFATKIASVYRNSYKSTDSHSNNYENLKDSYKIFSEIAKCFQTNLNYVTVISNIAGKTAGTCTAIVNSCRITLGVDKIQTFVGNVVAKAAEGNDNKENKEN